MRSFGGGHPSKDELSRLTSVWLLLTMATNAIVNATLWIMAQKNPKEASKEIPWHQPMPDPSVETRETHEEVWVHVEINYYKLALEWWILNYLWLDHWGQIHKDHQRTLGLPPRICPTAESSLSSGQSISYTWAGSTLPKPERDKNDQINVINGWTS